MIECPYCHGDISDDCIACKHCGHDLAAHVYILRNLQEIRDRLEKIEGDATAGAPSTSADSLVENSSADLVGIDHVGPFRVLNEIIYFCVLPILLLVIAYYLVVILFSLSPIWLLLSTLIIPLPFGIISVMKSVRGLIFWSFMFLCASIFSVLSMNIITGFLEQIPYLPQTHQEWIQNYEFAFSIYFSFLASMLTSAAILRYRYPENPKNKTIVRNVVATKHGIRHILSERTVELFNAYASAIGALASVGSAIYLGIQNALKG